VCIAPAFGCGQCAACQRGQENLCRHYEIRGEGGDGGLSEVVVVPERDLLPIPEHLDFEQAAALPLSGVTAWQMLRKAQLQPGETVLVLGGTSGVGSLAIQIAAAMGARVLATAGTPEKRQRCLELGAEQAFPHREDAPFHRQVKAATGGAGADVVMEHIGAATWERSLKALAWGGRLVTCGATTGAEVQINLRALFFKQQALIGSTMGTRADLLAYWSQVSAGRVRPVVAGSWSWGDLAGAHQALEAGVVGKVVVRVD
jgi:NADPH:quinone reductase-like Zn-dependent oxidoreductase